MALNAKRLKPTSSGGIPTQDIIPIDNYPARVVQVLDLGLQDGGEWKGKKKPPVNKIMVTYELVDCFCLDEEGNEIEDKPRWISEELNIFSPDEA